MTRNRNSIAKGQTDQEIGEFWDTHDLSDYWEKTEFAEFEVDIQSEATDHVGISHRLYEGQTIEEIFKRAQKHWKE